MKKLIAIPLLILYLVAVSGAMVQFHFCGQELASFSVNEAKEASCCCGPKASARPGKAVVADDDDCCKDKTVTLKIAQDQNTTQGVFLQLSALQVALLPGWPAQVFEDRPLVRPVIAYRAKAPPGRWQDIPLYKLHSRFTYYG
ncbi:HYC_CC_PP family protein [Taibaiella helva]|uniref:HYC_CC_PP family protein n=1 Tax=Taibaiella helva TaxID=2301235 RepID=UPI000E571144|nr:hypothetical protein [Taibaiella helva]